ncbi:MAG: hypothetical protein IIV72_06590, partial [Alistipes sp.]|nr:hypothetical protein [Alistipes sp.]
QQWLYILVLSIVGIFCRALHLYLSDGKWVHRGMLVELILPSVNPPLEAFLCYASAISVAVHSTFKVRV